jgi:hypothetical protein
LCADQDDTCHDSPHVGASYCVQITLMLMVQLVILVTLVQVMAVLLSGAGQITGHGGAGHCAALLELFRNI